MSDTGRPTSNAHPTAGLSAYVDGELDSARRAEIEAHLAVCPTCAAAAADLRGLARAAAVLADRPPERDLWPAIERRITARPRARVLPIQTARPRVALTWTQLVAASVALVVIGGSAVWLALSGRVSMVGSEPVRFAEDTTAAEGVLVADFATETYDAAVADLEEALEASRDRLDPATVVTIERNLEIIDQAIADTRRALAADPNSIYLSAHLAEQMQRKLDVLRTATAMVASI